MELAHKMFVITFAVIMINSVMVAEAGLSLGSVQVKKSVTVSAGESVQFKLLLFNVHDTDDLYITTDYTSPEGWSVAINPSKFTLPYREIGDKSYEEGFEFLGTGLGDVKVKPVWINVKIPGNEYSGSYTVQVDIKAKKGDSGVAMSQSRSYTYEIEVLGQVSEIELEEPEGNEEESPQQEEERERPFIPSAITPENNPPGIVQNATSFREQTGDQITDLTGMIISNPLIAPIALGIAILVFLMLRVFKRI